MTSCHKISPSLKEIIDAFVKNKFQPMTLADLSDILGEDPNTINQRILRDKDNLFFSPNPDSKPKKIQLKQTHADVICYIHNNQCHICRKTFKPEKLSTTYLDDQKSNPNTLSNLVVLCEQCSKSPKKAGLQRKGQKPNKPAIAKSTTQKVKKKSPKTTNTTQTKQNTSISWEFKSILIRYNPGEYDTFTYSKGTREKTFGQPNFEDIPPHYEYRVEGEEEDEEDDDEDDDEEEEDGDNDDGDNDSDEDSEDDSENESDDEPEWYYVEKKGEIASFAISDILNEFGKHGWDLAYMEHLSPKHIIHNEDDGGSYGGDDSENDEVPDYALFLCVLKRMRGNVS